MLCKLIVARVLVVCCGYCSHLNVIQLRLPLVVILSRRRRIRLFYAGKTDSEPLRFRLREKRGLVQNDTGRGCSLNLMTLIPSQKTVGFIPRHLQCPMVGCAISKIKIDERLIGKTRLF